MNVNNVLRAPEYSIVFHETLNNKHGKAVAVSCSWNIALLILIKKRVALIRAGELLRANLIWLPTRVDALQQARKYTNK